MQTSKISLESRKISLTTKSKSNQSISNILLIITIIAMSLTMTSCSSSNADTATSQSATDTTTSQIENKTENIQKLIPIEMYQFDEPWATEKYNNGENNDTVRGSGCGPGVMAIADATINNSDADIGTACKWSLEHDFFTTANGRTKDEFFEAYGEAHNLDVTQLYDGDLRDLVKTDPKQTEKYHDQAFESVKQGNWIVAFMGEGKWTTGGHFVLWYDVSDEEDVFIRDTNSKKDYKAKNKFDVFKETVIRYWEIQVPDDKKVVS